MNIIETYGTPVDGIVHYQNPKNIKAKGIINMNTRYIEMQPSEKQMPNFFWLDGPLEGDAAVRITATYPGQEPQCYNCLGCQARCPGLGKGKICVDKGTPRTNIESYMRAIDVNQGFKTLKQKHKQEFPELGQESASAQTIQLTRGQEDEDVDDKIVSLTKELQEANKGREEEQFMRQIAEEELRHMKSVLSAGSEEMEDQILTGLLRDEDLTKQIEALADMSYLPGFQYTDGEASLIPPKNLLVKLEQGVILNKLDMEKFEEVKKHLLVKILERKKLSAAAGIVREQSLNRSRTREKRGLEKDDSTRKVSRRRTHSPSKSPRKTITDSKESSGASEADLEDDSMEQTLSTSEESPPKVEELGYATNKQNINITTKPSQALNSEVKKCQVTIKNLHPQELQAPGVQKPAEPITGPTAASCHLSTPLQGKSGEQENITTP